MKTSQFATAAGKGVPKTTFVLLQAKLKRERELARDRAHKAQGLRVQWARLRSHGQRHKLFSIVLGVLILACAAVLLLLSVDGEADDEARPDQTPLFRVSLYPARTL